MRLLDRKVLSDSYGRSGSVFQLRLRPICFRLIVYRGVPSDDLLSQLEPGQLMLVVMEVQQPRSRDGGERRRALEVGRARKLKWADNSADVPAREPFLHQPEEPFRIANN